MVSSVAGLPTCWLPVWVPVICWVSAPLLAAKVAAADPVVSSAAKLRRRKVFDINRSCS
jgi:hypothetical protein